MKTHTHFHECFTAQHISKLYRFKRVDKTYWWYFLDLVKVPFTPSVFVVTERKYRVEDEFKDKEIVDYKHIEQGEILGKGAFGIVKKGRALLPGATIWTDVAIKTPKTTGYLTQILRYGH